MKPVKGGVMDGDPLGGSPAEAANEPMIDGGGMPPAWDPFEVWRTRVRDVRHDRSRPEAGPRQDKD
jgi:hypothetical protein